MSREDVQTNLRLPADLKDRLAASALLHNRSLSAEVAHRLQKSYEPATLADQAQTLMTMAKRTQLEVEMLRVEGRLGQVSNRLEQLAAHLDSSTPPRDAKTRQEYKNRVDELRLARAKFEEEAAVIRAKLAEIDSVN